MAEHGIDPAVCTPEQFPILTKSELIKHFDQIITARDVTAKDLQAFLHESPSPETLFRSRYVVIHTSGSSGEVGLFLYDPKAWARALAHLSRAKGFTLVTHRRKRIGFIGATQGHFAGVTSATAVRAFPLNLFYDVQPFEVNRPLHEAVVGLNAFQPDILVGYGTALKALAEKQLESELNIKPDVVTNSGEPLLAADRQVIERAFGKCLRNFYVCSEHLFMGLKEAWWDSMRLFEDDLIFEIQSDHTLVTNLFNRTLPLIRYKMTDILTPLDRAEHAPYRAIAEVAGRVEQQPKFRNRHGVVDGISPHTINEILVPHVRQFQMRLRSLDAFDFAMVFQAGARTDQKREAVEIARARLTAILAEKEMDNVTFELLAVEEIPINSKTRKFQLIMPAPSEQGQAAGHAISASSAPAGKPVPGFIP
jgi:phenylacetate-CoA ligase